MRKRKTVARFHKKISNYNVAVLSAQFPRATGSIVKSAAHVASRDWIS
jgi:hypothetical protein